MLAATGFGQDFRIVGFAPGSGLTVSGAFSNGVCAAWQADQVAGAWRPIKSVFTTAGDARISFALAGSAAFCRAYASDLSGGRAGFTNLTRAYGLLETLAGSGVGNQEQNNWRPEFEGAAATNVALSGPHIAMADRAGFVYVADKDAHAVRQVRPDGTLVTVAGISEAGDGPDTETNATRCALNQPNGLWVKPDGTFFVLDLGNGKVRRVSASGVSRTLFTVPAAETIQRGLWVSEDEALAYVTTYTAVKRWTAEGGLSDFSTGYAQMGNITVDPQGNLVVTDRLGHRVYRLDAEGGRTPIAGNGTASGGGDGQPALETGLNEVRGVWFLPSGAFVVCCHRGSQVWYIDTEGLAHLLLNGDRYGSHGGDGAWFYHPAELRVSKCRAVTLDYDDNLLITENDYGYVRRVRFLPFTD